jgi:acyl-CoA oxidase
MADFSDQLKPLYDGSSQLTLERQNSNIQTEELKSYLLSRDGFLARQHRIVKILENDPIFDKSQQMNLARPVRSPNVAR